MLTMKRRFYLQLVGLLSVTVAHATVTITPDRQARDILAELIAINTTDSVGNVTTAAAAMAARLRAAGIAESDIQLIGPAERKKNLVVRLRGSGRGKPILLIGHLDVVEAHRQDWSSDPFQLLENDGYFYGRGVQDMKGADAIMVSTLIRLKRAGAKSSRDIILALTADEEGGNANGVEWLFKYHRDLVDAEFALNQDNFSVVAVHGVPQFYRLQATEKVYADFQLTATNSGGHSSLPAPDNAIYELANGLARVERHEFPFELNAVTRGYYEAMAHIESGTRAADMQAILTRPPDPGAIERLSTDRVDHAIMRTTCVATRFDGGHANNALPQRAQAIINCRILPGHSPESVRQTLIEVLADPKIEVRYMADDGQLSDLAPDKNAYPAPPLSPLIMRPLETLVARFWPGLKIVPTQASLGTDAIWVNAAGIPVYLITGLQIDRDDDRMHGRNERLGIASFFKANEFFYQYLNALIDH